MIGCSVCERLKLLLRCTTERASAVEAKLSEVVNGAGNPSDATASQLLEEAIEAREIVDSARAVFDGHLQAHLATASPAADCGDTELGPAPI